MYSHMLVDTRNCIYRAIYAGLSDEKHVKSGQDHCIIFFRFLYSYITRYRPQAIHFFWDCPKELVWRKQLLCEYKEDRISKCPDIDKHLARCTEVCKSIIPFMNARQYEAKEQEADDLIYAFCKVYHRKGRILIISSDSDFKQISYDYENVDVFNPLSKEGAVYPREEKDFVEIKSFMGEKGDNIDGYDQIGPVRAENLANNLLDRIKFFQTHPKHIYIRNRSLIDLSLCPHLLKNMEYVKEIMSSEVSFDLKSILGAVQIYKVRGLSGEVSRIILPFKFLLGASHDNTLCADRSSSPEARRDTVQQV